MPQEAATAEQAGPLTIYLAERDEPCPACNYNLRGLTADRCPECNRELVLQIRLAEPRMALWVTALSGAAAMFGFHGLFVLVFAVVAIARRGSRLEFPMLVWLVVAATIGLILLWRLAVRRRAFCNLPIGSRLAFAIAIWVAAAVSAGMLPLLFR